MTSRDAGSVRKPTPFKNRDLMKIIRVLYTMMNLSATERKRLWLQDRLYNISQKITGMPNGRGGTKGLEASFAQISETEERYISEIETWGRELKEAENIINQIPSDRMRTFVTMRYLLHMGRKEIMGRMNLKRWKFQQLCELIEQAEDMASVPWDNDEY